MSQLFLAKDTLGVIHIKSFGFCRTISHASIQNSCHTKYQINAKQFVIISYAERCFVTNLLLIIVVLIKLYQIETLSAFGTNILFSGVTSKAAYHASIWGKAALTRHFPNE